MYINLLAAVAVTSVMAGQAGAATYTVAEYDMQVRYEGTGFTDAYMFSLPDNDLPDNELTFEGSVPLGNTSLGFKSYLFGASEIGTVFQFQLKIVHPHVPIYELFYGNGGRAPVCQLGPWDCTAVNNTQIYGDKMSFSWDDIFYNSISFSKGSVIDVSFWSFGADKDGPFFLTEDGLYGYGYQDEYSRFTILDIKDLAPVPLPPALALLPLGIGALALVRKRRRSAPA